MKKLFYYLPKGCGIAFSIREANEKQARKRVRELLQVKTLQGVQFWKG